MKKIIFIAAITFISNLQAADLTIPNTFTAGTPAVAADVNANFNAVETAVDDNNARINTNAANIASNTNALSTTGLHAVTVIDPPDCTFLDSVTTTYQKIGDMGVFSKISPTSTIEIQFNGRLSVDSMTSTGVAFELRVDDTATTNGRARSVVKAAETGATGVQSTITGIFTNLLAGNHTVSMWAEARVGGTATNAFWDPGCWSIDHVVVKEME